MKSAPAKSLALEVVSKSNALVPLQERATRIDLYHQGVLGAFAQQMGYAFLCGVELLAAKEECGHGAFMKWREQNLPSISNGSIANYMTVAGHLLKFPTVGNLVSERLQLGNGSLNDDDKKFLLETVHDATDGKTLTQFYRDLGLVKKPQAPKHHPVKVTPEEAEAARNQGAQDLARQLIGLLDTWHDDHDARARITAALRKELLEACVQVANDERAALKAQRTSRPGHKKKGKK